MLTRKPESRYLRVSFEGRECHAECLNLSLGISTVARALSAREAISSFLQELIDKATTHSKLATLIPKIKAAKARGLATS